MEGHESYSESGERYRYRNVTVLLSSDVSRQNDLVFMPNTIEMGILRKTDKGQYVSGIQFSDSMSEEDVKKRLILHFPNLENQRYIHNYSVFHSFSILPYERNSLYKLCDYITLQNRAKLQIESKP